MPRTRLFPSDYFPYHVTNRSNNKEWFYLHQSEVWQIFCEILTRATERYGVSVQAFVLMSNHYHLIASTPQGNLAAFMRYFQTEVCRDIQRQSGRINHVFGNRYKWSILTNAHAFAYAYKYVIRNPVRAKLTKDVQSYFFSSFSGLLRGNSGFPVTERIDNLRLFIPTDPEARTTWLNSPTALECEQVVGKALRRSEFKFSRGNEVRLKLNELEQSYGIPTRTRDLFS